MSVEQHYETSSSLTGTSTIPDERILTASIGSGNR